MQIDSPLTYRGALSLLGKFDRPALDAVEGLVSASMLAGGAVGVGWCFSAVDTKNDPVGLVRRLVDGVHARLLGTAGFERFELISAAHTTLVAAAFFEALQALIGPSYRLLRLTDDEKIVLLSGTYANTHRPVLERLWLAQIPLPGAGYGFAGNVEKRLKPLLHRAATACVDFLAGLTVWERVKAESRLNVNTLPLRLTALAATKYEGYYSKLAGDVPEFRMWALLGEFAATHGALRSVSRGVDEVNAKVSRLEALLGAWRVAPPRSGSARDLLNRVNQAYLRHPILDSVATEDRPLKLPTLEEIYVIPKFRVAVADGTAHPADERWWRRQPVVEDVELFVANFLASPECAGRSAARRGRLG